MVDFTLDFELSSASLDSFVKRAGGDLITSHRCMYPEVVAALLERNIVPLRSELGDGFAGLLNANESSMQIIFTVGLFNSRSRTGQVAFLFANVDQPLATPAINAICDHLFSTTAIEKIETDLASPQSDIFTGMTNAGFKVEARFDGSVLWAGERADLIWLGLFRESMQRKQGI